MGKRKNIQHKGIEVTAMSSEGKGIARIDEKVVFIDNALPEDVADIEIYRRKKSFDTARIKDLVKPAEYRIEPQCAHFNLCGGCKWQNATYPKQLEFKQQIVQDAFERIGKVDLPAIDKIIGTESDFFYRNKMEFTFSSFRWLETMEIQQDEKIDRRGLGFHIPGRFDKIVHVDKCWLQNDLSNNIRNAVHKYALENDLTYFDLKHQHGFLRNLIVRTTTLNEVMVLFSFHEQLDEEIEALMNHIQQQFEEITTVTYVINPKRNDTIFDLEVQTHYGKGYIYEQLGDFKFKIGPKSFFQTNSKQAKNLYDVIADFADLKGTENVYDLYCGVGSIGIYLSKQCAKVIGIEEIEAAVKDAEQNAALNKLTNATFIAGDARKVVDSDFAQEHGKPDVVITDPPRAGMHESVVRFLNELKAPKLVYVSCNPATQARDIQLLDEVYTVEKLQPVDMFPQTNHIENVALLRLR